MSANLGGDTDTALRVAESCRGVTKAPWEVFAQRLDRHEIHLNGTRVELRREPIRLEGYGIRLLRPRGDETQVGFASSSDLSREGIRTTARAAQSNARFSRFPAKSVALPGPGEKLPNRETVDRKLSEDPKEALEAYVHTVVSALEGAPDCVLSFGSVRGTLGETTIVNSEGLERHYPFTLFELEFALKSSAGPEGAPPGEYWVNDRARRMETKGLPEEVGRWARQASDVRRAKSPPTGSRSVLFPSSVLAEILPPVLGYRLSGVARLRHLAPSVGDAIAAEAISLHDDGTVPLALGTSPCDDEGVVQRRQRLLEGGRVTGYLLDVLHGGSFAAPSTANAKRDSTIFPMWFHFTHAPRPGPTTLVLSGPGAGSDEELIETVEDGIWIDQIGYSSPDALSGTFGGEIRMGYRILHGKLAEPLKGGTVGGFLVAPPGKPSLLSSIGAMGASARLCGHLKAPTCRVDDLAVAGT